MELINCYELTSNIWRCNANAMTETTIAARSESCDPSHLFNFQSHDFCFSWYTNIMGDILLLVPYLLLEEEEEKLILNVLNQLKELTLIRCTWHGAKRDFKISLYRDIFSKMNQSLENMSVWLSISQA